METTKTVRFWDRVNGGWVRLSLREQESVEHGRSEQHDEGWSRRHTIWSLEDGILSCATFESGTDCDGRHDHFSEYEAVPGEVVQAMNADGQPEPGVFRPRWREAGSEQRDHRAEDAGY